MKKSTKKLELLAPCGNIDAAKAAISLGANSIYAGLDTFSARAYAKNFSINELQELVNYAHLNNVKLYITMNTILFEEELDDAFSKIDELAEIGVDAIIVQDLALLDYITNHYPTLEAHVSTQMGIDDLDGALMCEKWGAKRVVLGRETNIQKIKEISENTNISLEIFAHGALCVSYSGNCLMSGLIGLRSGNRGRCVGACRKEYELHLEDGTLINKGYLLSTKDLNIISHLDELKNYVDTLKIEGRMRDESYVACATKSYREALDKTRPLKEIEEDLLKTFHRTYTKGYLFYEDKKDISNITKPNNYGYLIGEVIDKYKNLVKIKLLKPLNQLDNIRIASTTEINTCVNKLYNKNMDLINGSPENTIVYLEIKERVNIHDQVYKTKDVKYLKELEKTYPKVFNRLKVDMMIVGKHDSEFNLVLKYLNYKVSVTSSIKLAKSINQSTSYETIYNQLSKLGNTVYELNELKVLLPNNSFIPMKELNELRRKAIIELDLMRTNITHQKVQKDIIIPPIKKRTHREITVYAHTKDQFNAAHKLGIQTIYYQDNIIRRNKTIYYDEKDYLLISGLNGIHHYKNTDIKLIADSTLNTTNSQSIIKLLSNGITRVTLSHELNKKSINSLIDKLEEKLDFLPELEMIVYGRQTLMETTYCPLKKEGLCGKCRDNTYYLKDEFSYFPILNSHDCEIKILNGKILNLLDNLDELDRISHFRINLTTETYDEALSIIENAQKALNGEKIKTFSGENTRGHYNREIL